MRSRITITISEDLLELVDQTIDNYIIRNRSQAIETLLRQAVQPRLATAVILAGGRLTKHPKTEANIPKAMIPIKGEPVLHHLLAQLVKFNFRRVVLLTSPTSHQLIIDYLQTRQYDGIQISYSKEKKSLGTGGALLQAADIIPEGPFLLLHGDVLTNIDLHQLAEFYFSRSMKAVLAIKPRPGKLHYGQVYMEGSNVIAFKVPQEASEISLINTGIYVFDYSVLEMLPKDKSVFDIETTLIPALVKQKQIAASVFQGIWFDVSDPDNYREAETRWNC